MQYTDFGKTGLKVSRFGLGTMRLPADEKAAIEIVRYAIDHGVNYIDTAYIYAGSEELLGKALADGYREKVTLVTKCPVIYSQSHADFEKFLDEQLRRLKVDYVDVYMLHNLSPGVWEKVKKYDGIPFLEEMRKKGKIRFKGFSIHNTFEAFKEVIASAPDWSMTQIQLNILDQYNQAGGTQGLKYAAAQGLPVVIMEPLRGGSLVEELSDEGRKLIEEFPEKRTFVEWCMRWLYSKPEASVILSGTSTLDQLKDQLRIFEHAAPNVMTEAEERLITELRRTFEAQALIGCTDCKYCLPCPKTVLIPSAFACYNRYMRTRDESIKKAYMSGSRKADLCVGCRQCERHCPQGLEISKLLKEVHAVLSN